MQKDTKKQSRNLQENHPNTWKVAKEVQDKMERQNEERNAHKGPEEPKLLTASLSKESHYAK